jgi:glycosyltransferase involved in cell wall biosynthesis
VLRLGIDATSVGPEGKGIARVQRHIVPALRELGRHELVVFSRRYRPSLLWEQAVPIAYRRNALGALLTWSERLPLAGGGCYLVWLFEPPTHRIAANRAIGAGAYQRAADLATQALWKRSLRRAAVVFTGSDATRDALDVPARTLYPGLDPRFTPGRDGSMAEGREYVLYIGSSDPREDTDAALRAFAGVDVEVRVVGGWVGPPQDHVTYLGRVSDDELVRLYRGASAYVDTSRYEGFGFQVLEAMACGTPVLATGGTSIPEIVGGAGIVCAPDELGGELRRVLEDDELAQRLRRSGLARAGEFTWARAARTIADAVDEVAT